MEMRGRSSEVERQLPKLNVVGSIPIARSNPPQANPPVRPPLGRVPLFPAVRWTGDHKRAGRTARGVDKRSGNRHIRSPAGISFLASFNIRKTPTRPGSSGPWRVAQVRSRPSRFGISGMSHCRQPLTTFMAPLTKIRRYRAAPVAWCSVSAEASSFCERRSSARILKDRRDEHKNRSEILHFVC